jgi:hypothetical protein
MEAVVGEPWVGLVCEWCNVWSKSDDHLLAVLLCSAPLCFLPPTSSSSCPRPSITPYTPHTQRQAAQAGQGEQQGAWAGLDIVQLLSDDRIQCFFHELLMAAQSGFFVAKPSTPTTILCTPPPQDALRQGEGHAGPAAQPRGGERAAL